MSRTIRIGEFLKESRIAGSTGSTARKITVKLYGKGVFAKQENRPGSENTSYYKRKAGQFIYSKLDFLNGAFGIVPKELDGYESTVDLPCFDFTSPGISPEWFLQFVSRSDFYSYHGGLGNGGRKARRISPDDFLNLEIQAPPLPEQKKIAEILSGIDKEIGTLSKQIQKYQQIRAATIKNKILSGKGVTTRLGDIFQIQWGNTSITKASYTENGFTAFSASGADGYLSSYEHDCKGIVISAIGAQCGKVFWAEGKWTAIKNTMTITAGSSAMTLRYLYHILSLGDYLTGEGGAQPFISQTAAREREIFLPDPREMSAFEESIDKMDETIRLSSKKLSKAKLLKSSLSSDLLSGRKRVSV